ncbi:MAG: type II toxin-antitoxin system RelE/ParE family toxin [Bacteroidetes bacterium]|nr:type II toxin-antitoxin system RelE/ParE family toxin [Bacteroidota bacterium]MBU1423809.1 type II toxin-antitoxin system RelE/ParE family toxin [Bacteroidota bacterium]MBU2471302.1 type II toxin-antitoxin system RelE/ParE family toxin [Bacteroidota bacterium]MBU2637127.1 type II toxin-antitoxin system RelE/ParE family toxin [Bacteroidota bacterium]
MGKIKWTEKANNHLIGIYNYIARDSKTYAGRFIRSLIKATEKLEIMPRSGRIVPELENYGFREVIYQNYRIVYRITSDESVQILAVLHCSRNFNKAFNEEWDLS